MSIGKHEKQYLAIDLFAGCGGLSLGLEAAGFVVVAAVESDNIAAQTYQKNHPNTIMIKSDIRRVTAARIRGALALGNRSVDLLAGCPPCQGFSRIKRKNAKNDDRNNLILDFLRIAKKLRPKLILLENVPGLANDYRFDKFVKYLMSQGYQCSWAILNAADFGVPQRRKRLIMVASRLGGIELPEPRIKQYKTVKDYIGRLQHPYNSTDPLHMLHMRNTPRIKQLIAKIPLDGGSRKALSKRDQLACHRRICGFHDVYGRMKWNDVAPTLTSGCFNPSKGRFLHPRQNRPISIREAALLQTFPKKYYFPPYAGLSALARMIGNALPPLFARKQGDHLMKYLRKI